MFDKTNLQKFVAAAKKSSKSIVLVTGVFDVFHHEHLSFLNKAKELADVLIVGIESDQRVTQLKGEGRPVNNWRQRVKVLEETKVPDYVFVLPEQFSKPEDHISLIGLIKPNYLAISESSPHQDKKQKIMEQFGGQLKVVHKHNPEVSSTKLINQSKKST